MNSDGTKNVIHWSPPEPGTVSQSGWKIVEKLNEFPELNKLGFSRIGKMSFCTGDDMERSDERIENELQSTPVSGSPGFCVWQGGSSSQ